MNTFSKLYITLWIALIVVEIVAATTSYVPLDTMSENYWWIQDKSPVLMRVILSVGLLVLWVHLGTENQSKSNKFLPSVVASGE